MNLAIIPARGGSKRIPRKNIKNFIDKPIISYSIKAAIDSKLFEEVMVSTDDEEIAEIAIKYGAKIPFFRSKKNSNDFATTFDVISEVITSYLIANKKFENTCCLYACAPFVNADILIKSYKLFIKEQYDSLFPVTSFGYPIQRALEFSENKLKFLNPEFELTRSQDLIKTYHDVGQFYWMNNDKILQKNKILTNNTGAIILSELEAQDIDNVVDWKLAELKYELLQSIK